MITTRTMNAMITTITMIAMITKISQTSIVCLCLAKVTVYFECRPTLDSNYYNGNKMKYV